MKIASLVQLIVLCTAGANAQGGWVKYGKDYYSAMGCKIGVDKVANFCGTTEVAKTYNCICTNENALVSWLECGKANHPDVDFNKFLDQVVDLCHENAKPKPKKTFNSEFLLKLYDDNKDRIVSVQNASSSDFPKTNTSFPVTGPAVKKAAYPAYMSYYNRWQNINVSHYLGIAFLAFVGFILIASGVINWAQRFNVNTVPKFIKKYITMGILGKTHLHSNGIGLNPDRLETIFIAFTFLYSLLGCVVIGFYYVKGDPVFTNYQAGTSRYYGDRAAILLSYQLPLLFIFPGRNNFFQLVSRWKYSRFVTLHKWFARIIFMEILIHGCAMASQTYALKKFTRFGTDWYREGITAAVTASVIIIFAMGPLRKHYYEFFLVAHIILVVQFLWLAWRHASSQDYQNYYWACVAIWVFDRFIRLCRITLHGVAKTADVQYFPGEEIIKVTVDESKILKTHPGAHAFVYFLTPTKFWQSHPFTAYPSVEQPGKINFVCRVKKGITRNLADKAMAAANGKLTMKIAVEGFYGEQTPYQNYDKAVFITGGTGIAGPFYHAKKLSQTNPDKEIKLYWSVRTYQSIICFIPEIQSFKDTNVKPIIYISKPELSSSSGSSDDNKEKDSSPNLEGDEAIIAAVSFADIRHGRMSTCEIVTNEIEEANGSIAFGACAHTQVVDEVRRTVASVLTSTSNRVDYYEEMQMW